MVKKDIVLETLQGLVKNGEIKPEEVVESARDENSPIHNNFEWDNTVAGRAYRLWQARQLITCKFNIDGSKEQQYYNIRTVVNKIPTRGYFTKEKILSDKDMYIQLLREAIGEIKYWKKKYIEIKELAPIINEDKIEEIENVL